MDSVQSKAHGAALDLMGANAGAPESLKALADTLAAQWEGAENVPAVVLVALGHVAIARGQVDADCQRWHAEAREATQARHALSEELSEARESLAEWHAKAKRLERERDSSLRDSLIWAAESDERGAVLAGLAEALAALPLAVLASTGDAGKLAALYLRAEVLTGESPKERHARLAAKLESGNAD